MSRFGAGVELDRPAFIHETALIYGRVRIGEGVSLWPYAVIRAESNSVEIGPGTNIQDHAMVHIGGDSPTVIGAWCSITHKVCVHGATIGDNCLIGIGATIMDRAVIGANSIVAGHSIVTEGTIVPPGSIVAGVPAKVIARRDGFEKARRNALIYLWNARAYAEGRHRAWDEPAYRDFVEAEMEKARRERIAATL